LVDGPAGAEHGQTDGTHPTAGQGAKNPSLSAIPADKDEAVAKIPQSLPAIDKKPARKDVAKLPSARPAAPKATQQALKQLAVTASAASGWQMATAAEKYLQDF